LATKTEDWSGMTDINDSISTIRFGQKREEPSAALWSAAGLLVFKAFMADSTRHFF